MKTKPFALIVLAILIAQPLVISTSIALDGLETRMKLNDTTLISQEPGTRLTPEEHTNHVPVYINGTPEFTAQSWDGSGTEGDPYVISGLNITYDHPDYLIKITNTDAYFVIEDCYLGQLSQESGILLENVTHGVIRYVTLISGGGGAYFENAGGSIIDHVYVDAGKYYGLYINYSPQFELMDSFIDSITSAAVWVNSSGSSTLSDTIFDSAIPYTDLSIRYSDDVSLLNAEFHGSSIELYVYNCSNFYGDGLVATEGNEGIWLFECEDSEIRNADITSEYNALYMLDNYNISISDSTFSNTQGSQCLNLVSNSEILFDQILVNDTNNQALSATSSHDVTISNSAFSNIPGECIWFTSSNDTSIISNTFGNIDDTVIAVTTASHRANVSYNIGIDLEQTGFYSSNSDNGTFSYNTFLDVDTGAYLQASSGWEIHNNVVENAITGINIEGGAHSDIWNNDISMSSSYGFYILGHGVVELWENTVTDSDIGMYLESCDYQYVRDNSITLCETGMYQETTVNSTINDNVISDCAESGIYLIEVVTTEFNGNNISRCGKAGFDYYNGFYNNFVDNNLEECGFNFLEFASSIAKYNHTFSGNMINGKPLFYAITQTGLSINGSEYGQVILINCTDSSVFSGDFISCTSAVQVNFGGEIDISGIYGENLWMPIYVQFAYNVTITDSVVFGNEEQNGIFVWDCPDIWIENCNFTGTGGSWLGDDATIKFGQFSDVTVIDCGFTDITGNGIGFGDGFISSGSYGEIIDCAFVNVTVAIYGENAQYINVTNNEMQWCDYGILSDISDYWRVEWNDIQNGDVGIFRDVSYDWLTANNTIRWNRIGIELQGTFTPGTTADNIIALNFEANGVDDTFRYWDDAVDTGNYWHDWDGSAPYVVSGAGASEDRYPMHYVVPNPIINTPEDLSYAEESEGNTLTWLPFDDYLRDWTVTIDGAPWASGIWDFSNVTVNIDGLAYGTHTVFITIWDVDLNYVNDTVIVHVYDDILPEISGPVDQVLFVDEADLTLVWEVSDLNPDNYVVTLDDVEYETGTWTSGTLTIDFAGISAGTHNITVTIYDADGNMAEDLVVVSVIDDDTAPTIDHPDDVEYVEGTTGNSIVWTPEDDNPDIYTVYSNGTLVESGGWAGSRITINVDGLAVGSYEYTITVYDGSGNSATDTVNVIVIPIIPIEPPLPPIDWVLLIIIAAVVGAVIVVIVLIYYLKKKKPA